MPDIFRKRYLRLLAAVLAMVVIGMVVCLRHDYVTDVPKVVPSTNAEPKVKGSILDKIPFYGGEEKPEMGPKKKEFPISSFWTRREIYHKVKLLTFADPFKLIKGKPADYEFKPEVVCDQLQVESELEVTDSTMLEADFDTVKEKISQHEEYQNLIELAKNTFKPEIPEKNQWFRFAVSSVWLEELQIHFMISRLIYSPSGIPNKGFASFLYAQIYDRDWKEITEEIEVPYEQSIVQNVINSDGSVTEMVLDKSLAYRKIQFPSLLPIPFDYTLYTVNNKFYYGPEDPRILKRVHPTLGYEEPMIVFNMKDNRITKRVMHLYLPFSTHLKMLKKRSEKFANIEKNWTPFVSRHQPGNKLNFMYSITPLEILTCDIDDGMCDFLQKVEKENFNYIGPLRGGSQLVSLPFDEMISPQLKDHIKLPQNRAVYIGWARTHLNKCGCGESMYRPNLIVLIEDYNPSIQRFYYKMGAISDFIDFNVEVPPWLIPEFDENNNLITDKDINVCDKSGRNVLIPNSIAYWDIDSIIKNGVHYAKKYFDKVPSDDHLDDQNGSQENKLVLDKPKEDTVPKSRRKEPNYPINFNDYMGVTLSGADSDVSIVHVKGLLNYILNINTIFDESNVIDSDQTFNLPGIELNGICSERAAHGYCKAYAEDHGGVVEYE